jgi:hypothetical protein
VYSSDADRLIWLVGYVFSKQNPAQPQASKKRHDKTAMHSLIHFAPAFDIYTIGRMLAYRAAIAIAHFTLAFAA